MFKCPSFQVVFTDSFLAVAYGFLGGFYVFFFFFFSLYRVFTRIVFLGAICMLARTCSVYMVYIGR